MREGLTYKKLKDIGVVITGNTPSTKDKENYSSDDYCFVKPSDIAKDGVSIIKDSESYISEKGYNSSRKLPKGSVLTTCIGIIGKVGILEIDATCNQQINAIIPFRTILPKYLALAILSVKSQLEAMANAPVVPIINKGDFSNVEIPVPSFEEQERIVAELDLLTGIIDKQKQQLKELDTLAQSIFYDMFGSVDNNTKNFMVKCLNEVFQLITDGTHQTPQYTDDILHGFKFLSAKDVVSGVIDWTRIKYIPESLHNELYKRLAPRRGDILLCKNGTTGICALVETDEVFDIYVSLALLRTEKEYNKKYLVYAINNPSTKSQFDDSLKGVGVPNLHLGEIKKTKILVPPIELQSSFAKKIESIESQKQSINRSLAESQKLFDYTMDKYFG